MNSENQSLFDARELTKLSESQTYEYLNSSKTGLTEAEAESRLTAYGLNRIAEQKKEPLIFKFLANFYHLFAILLWIGGILAFLGDLPQLGYAIFTVIVINAVFSFLQEFKAEKATEALKKLLPKQVKVIRDGIQKQILAEHLVLGDVMILDEGDSVSADGRLIEESEMRCDNSVLTGESRPARRSSDAFFENVSETEFPNFIFAGTNISSGNGKAVVFATAMNTQFGKIASLTQSIVEEPSPLQKEMNTVTKIVALLAIGVGAVFFLIGTLTGLSFKQRFLFAVGIIVANVPEGLLPTLTLSLALGVQKMARKHALMKKLSAVETLGSTTVICTDKTGTLTQNEMTVRNIYTAGKKYELSGIGYDPQGAIIYQGNVLPKERVDSELSDLITSMTLCNNSKLIQSDSDKRWKIIGDPTEGCLLVAAGKCDFSIDQLNEKHQRIYQLPFDSSRKRMSTINLVDDKQAAFIKGAPKETISLCSKVRLDNEIKPLTEQTADEFIKVNDDFARAGLRVLAIAKKELPDNFNDYSVETVENEMTLLGLVAMMDPPRPEVQAAVEMCFSAGIKIIMITGDYGLTAESIARKIGIVKGNDVTIITGAELEKMDEPTLIDIVSRKNIIFARVSPEHKMKVVSALKDKGETVAVTGDGVNDAPALKRADIGVAMGITGTDVAKEAAEMVLTDDNFASIVNAVEEGRSVFDNIRKFIVYIFAHLTPEAIPFILFVLFKVPLAINVMQILAIDLGTETLPALALGVEPAEPDIMNRPPRSRTERLLNAPILLRAYVFLGLIETALILLIFFFVLFRGGWSFNLGTSIMETGHPLYHLYLEASTLAFLGIVATQVGTLFASRTNRASLLTVGIFSNKIVLYGIVFEIIVSAIFIYLPFFQKIFGTTGIPLIYWIMFLVFPPIIIAADEARKAYVRKKMKQVI